MNEEWRDVLGYEGLYLVNRCGDVWSVYSKRLLTPFICSSGYLEVTVSKDGKRKALLVHRIVAQAFIPNPGDLPEVNHKNENKLDNRVENLEWVTSKENANYGTRTKRQGTKLMKPVYQYTTSGEFVKRWDSLGEIQDELKYHKSNISACCLGKYQTMYGYRWSYK